jgi:hypothetical protein
MRVVALFVLAVWCAECAWGGFTVVDYPVVLLFLGPLYGGAALVIREVARRRGAGWPGIVLLAAAFGLFQAGLVDQSLFDRSALASTEFAAWNEAAGATVFAGVSAEQLFDWVGGHVWLSICAPIALAEAGGRREPWLGRRGVSVAAGLWVAGSLLIWSDSGRVVSPVQVVVVLAVCGVLVLAALRRSPRAGFSRRRPWVVLPRWVPRVCGERLSPLVLGGLVAGAHVGSWFFGSQWLGFGLRLVTVAVVAVVLVRCVVSERQVVAVAGAGVLVAAGAAWLAPPYQAAAPWLMVLSDVVVSVVAVVVVTVAYRQAKHSRQSIELSDVHR